MDIIISSNSEEPIYILIKNIIDGKIKDNDQLPSLRVLAKELRVSILTINRAYSELEKEGFIFSVQGSGFFVGDTESKLVKEQYIREIENHFTEAIKLGNISNLSLDELIQILEMLYKVENDS